MLIEKFNFIFTRIKMEIGFGLNQIAVSYTGVQRRDFNHKNSNPCKIGWIKNALAKHSRKRCLVQKNSGLGLDYAASYGCLDRHDGVKTIDDFLLRFKNFLDLFFIPFFVRLDSLHQYALTIAMPFGAVAVDAQYFGDVILIDFERENDPHLAEGLQQNEHDKASG
jgi:hypothetical protein